MQLGTEEIPEIRLKPDCQELIKKIYDEVKSGEIGTENLSRLLGYARPQSGGFYPKVKSLISYGLLHGRGKYSVTELGKKLAYPPPDEKTRLLLVREALFNVPLWIKIYNKHKRNLTDDFWYTLQEFTNAEQKDINDNEKDVRKWYLQDMLSIPEEVAEFEQDSNTFSSDANNNTQMSQKPVETMQEGLVDYGYGKYKVFLPEDESEAKQVWEKIKKMVDPLFSDQ